MKKYTFHILLFIFCITCSGCFAENNYTPHAIQLYNAGGMFQNQGKYEQAIEKYNAVLLIQPDMLEAKHNLSVLYGNLAIRCFDSQNYSEAVFNAKKSLVINPNNLDILVVLGDTYKCMGDSVNAIPVYKKAVALNFQNIDTMHSLAEIYLKQKKYSEAKDLYSRILVICPMDNIALNNSAYIKQQVKEKQMVSSLNDIKQCAFAPEAVYSLLKPAKGISHTNIKNAKYMLDLIYSDSTGKILLDTLAQKNVPVNLTKQHAFEANATFSQTKDTLYFYGFIPAFTFNKTKLEVNIPEVHVENFMNFNLSSQRRIYSLHALIHEFCHAYRFIEMPSLQNSIEEEIGASMIGFNVSYKVISGNYLTVEQTKIYSEEVLKALLSDSHRVLPVYSGFQNCMISRGIIMPHPAIYKNIVLMYKKLLRENKISPVSTFSNLNLRSF